MSKQSGASARSLTIGVGEALTAYLWWGVVTGLYYAALEDVPAFELLAWRVFSGLPIIFMLLLASPGIGRLGAALRDRKTLQPLLLSAVLIAINWFTFMYAILTERLVQASLGYFINPLVLILLARMILGERVQRIQFVALAIAAAGVVVFTVAIISTENDAFAEFPWIPFVLPVSFGLYGLLRKQMRADAVTGLTIEMGLLFPVMLAIEGWVILSGSSILPKASVGLIGMILLGGVVTVVPLTAFAAAARRLRLTTLGLLQFIAPTGQFALAIWLGEPFGPWQGDRLRADSRGDHDLLD